MHLRLGNLGCLGQQQDSKYTAHLSMSYLLPLGALLMSLDQSRSVQQQDWTRQPLGMIWCISKSKILLLDSYVSDLGMC